MKSNHHDMTKQLGSEPILKLLVKFSVPTIIALLVSALYNIVDQIFIGQGVGYLGNAATSVAFPLVVIALGISLMIGEGGSALFSLKNGQKDVESTTTIVGNVVSMLVIFGIFMAAFSLIFLKPILINFGATDAVMPYALDYTKIIALGLPFAIFCTGFNAIIRSDGNPKYSMIVMLSGAIINTILDPIFIFGFDMGVAGAAYATLIGQFSSTLIALAYFKKFRSITFKITSLKLNLSMCKTILAFGVSSLITQLSIAVVAICTNNVLTQYGAQSIYGSEIPLSVFGIVTKVNQIMLSLLLGIAIGAQPILGFNYGAKNIARVKETFKYSVIGAMIVSLVGLLFFEVFPQQIINIFGAGDALYNEFGVMYFRIFLVFCTFTAVQIVCTIFFQAVGQPTQSAVLSLSRQIIFYLPFLYILPKFIGIKGAIIAGPIADSLAFILTLLLISKKWKALNRLETELETKCS